MPGGWGGAGLSRRSPLVSRDLLPPHELWSSRACPRQVLGLPWSLVHQRPGIPPEPGRLVPLYRHTYSKCISRNPKEFLGRQLRKWLLLRAIILIICWFSYSDLGPNGSQHANGNLQLLLKRLGLSFCAICVFSHPLLVAWRINISRVPIPWIPESCGEKKKIRCPKSRLNMFFSLVMCSVFSKISQSMFINFQAFGHLFSFITCIWALCKINLPLLKPSTSF